jgi:hypothetical protein
LKNGTTDEGTRRARAIARLRKALTFLAYASLVLDIIIAIVTSVGALKIGDLKAILIPTNYALTAVVIFSAVAFVALLVEKATRRGRPQAGPVTTVNAVLNLA